MAGWYPDFLPGEIEGTGTLLGNPIGPQLSLVEQSSTIQLVQQSPYLQLSGCTFSVEEEVAFGPENLCLAETEIMQRIDAALTLTECQPLRHRHPGTLSGGETQRVVIASALAMQPKILILDEAFSRLTAQTTAMLLARLQQWAQEQHALVIFSNATLHLFSAEDAVYPLPAGMAAACATEHCHHYANAKPVSYRWPNAADDCLRNISLELPEVPNGWR